MEKDENTFTLSKVAREYRVTISVILGFLHEKGIDLTPNPNTIIPVEAYDLITKNFNVEIEQSEAKHDFTKSQSKPNRPIIGKIDLERVIKNHSDNLQGVKHPSGKTRQGIFPPLVAIGTLKFFDYRVNKFGIITDIKCASNIQIDKVHVSESGLASERQLFDGEKVTFELNKGIKGFFATSVMPFSDITLKTMSVYSPLFEADDLVFAFRNIFPFGVSSTYFNELTDEGKLLIKNLVRSRKEPKVWGLISKINDNELINDYLSSISSISVQEKISLLNVSFNYDLLNDILLNWSHNDKSIILSLVNALQYENISISSLPDSLIDGIKNTKWNFDEIWQIYSYFETPELKDEVLRCFSFIGSGSVTKFKSLAPSRLSLIDEERLRSNLTTELDNISASALIDIFSTLSEYNIITSGDRLLELLGGKCLTVSNIEDLLAILPKDSSAEGFRNVILNSIGIIKERIILDILNKCVDKDEFAQVILDVYFSTSDPARNPDYFRVLDYYKGLGNSEMINVILNNYHSQLLAENPFELFYIALAAENIEIQKLAYQNITFKSEQEIMDFIGKIKNFKISQNVKTTNKPLSDFVRLILSESDFKLTPECQKFLQINKGRLQSHTIKFLIFQHYKERVTKPELREILNSFQWTEISAILINTFIQETEYTEKFLLNKLDLVYKKHYEILNEQEFDHQSFLDNFSISNLLNKCDGRKYYSMKKWEKDGMTRWYMESDVLHESWESYDSQDLYCEGRPWKRENIWDAKTNNPITRKIDFYWCRNKSCAGRNDKVDLSQSYYNWTLAEITEALKIPIEKNVLANLAGWVNRINKILDHLFCRNCNEILRPLPYNPSTLGYYAVPVFQCINSHCTEYGKKVRLTHCLNGKCESHIKNEPLDSRDCVSCKPSDPNHTGLKCNYCGQSCPACSGYSATKVQETW